MFQSAMGRGENMVETVIHESQERSSSDSRKGTAAPTTSAAILRGYYFKFKRSSHLQDDNLRAPTATPPRL